MFTTQAFVIPRLPVSFLRAADPLGSGAVPSMRYLRVGIEAIKWRILCLAALRRDQCLRSVDSTDDDHDREKMGHTVTGFYISGS